MAISLTQLLQALVQNKGSDLHIAVNSVPMIRVRGEMMKIEVPALTAADVDAMIKGIVSPEQNQEFYEKKSIDFAFKATGIGVFRVNLFQQRHGISVVMRVLSENPPKLSDISAPAICETACSYTNGLVLVCGPTGSGKSTTLAAMINHINLTTRGHILTLEDPVEFQHESKLCMMNQRSLGANFTDFASALKAGLREDPDVILVGEMRDPETMSLAIKAAETGHLVFSTLHTNSAAKTVDRIINSFPAGEQPQIRTVLSETLKVVIAQKLIPSADKKRRICMHDILVNTPAVANLIREGKTFQITSIMQTGQKEGMQVLDKKLQDAVSSGEVEGQVAWEYANDKALFAKYAPGVKTVGAAMVVGQGMAPAVAKTVSVPQTAGVAVSPAANPAAPAPAAPAAGTASSQVRPVVKKVA